MNYAEALPPEKIPFIAYNIGVYESVQKFGNLITSGKITSRLAFSISSYVPSPIHNFEYLYLYQQSKNHNFPQYDRLPH